MSRVDASFLITGEVVGQRPMSQNKSALNAVDKLSGYRGLSSGHCLVNYYLLQNRRYGVG